MSTAEYQYRVNIDSGDVGNSTNALDAFTTRTIISNLNHLADEFAQVGACMSGTTAALSGKSGYLETGTPTFTATPFPIWSTTFPIKVRAGGQSYRMRVRLGGASGNTASTVFYAALHPASIAPRAVVTGLTDDIYKSDSTTSSTAAWLAGVSRGPLAYARMIEMPAERVNASIVTRPTLTALGGNPASVQVALVSVTIYATTANVAHVPRLFAVYLAEAIGT